MKENKTLKDFHVTTYVPWDEIERVLGKRKYKQFLKWMNGQTCSMHGAFPDDLERWLKGLPVLD